MAFSLCSFMGQAAVAAHIAIVHDDHDHDDADVHELEAVIHGHAHEPGTVAHEHRFSGPTAASAFASVAKRVSRGASQAGPAYSTLTASDGPAILAPIVAMHGAGPPLVLSRSPILRI
jgi:hypothetical protein